MYIDYPQVLPKSYYLLLTVNLITGCLNAGFFLASPGVNQVLDVQETGWRDDRVDFNNTLIASIVVFGLMVGSIFSKPILALGRRRSILLSNLVITFMTIPYFFVDSLWVLASTRFVLGVASAVILNASGLIVGEFIPSEYQVYCGICVNFGIVAGIFIINCFNLAFLPYWSDKDPVPAEAKDTYMWRISYSLQLIPVAITTLMWLFVFKNEPLRFLIAKTEQEGLKSKAYIEAIRVLRKNYELTGDEQSVVDTYADVCRKLDQAASSSEKPGYRRALTNPAYRRATIICIGLAIAN